MKPPRKYASATAFRVALEDRLKRLAQEENIDLQRVRRQAAFDRLLCRLFAKPDAPWLLKGGYAMELRLKTARTTRDVDLALKQLPMPTRDTRLAGRSFVKFHLDVSTGDVLREPYESLSGRDWLGFAGIASTGFRAVSPEEQFAEKLHAYTLPRVGRENSRVKDLVDLVLLIERTTMNAARLPKAIRETFQRRKTHEIPPALASPPVSWSKPFAELAVECGLAPNVEGQFELVAKFFSGLSL